MWTTLGTVGDKATGLGINPTRRAMAKIAEMAEIL
jgi:hypothetical protein